MRALPAAPQKSGTNNGWIVTFADLMSLLLTFFILLLSFSEMDVEKYQRMAASLASSFGLQVIQGEGAVGGSIIIAENPPGSVVPDIDPLESVAPEQPLEPEPEVEVVEPPPEAETTVAQIDPSVQRLTENLVDELEEEILSNALSVNYESDKVVVRFSESATFTSGSESLKEEMLPIITKIEDVLSECDGQIVVSGYTDDLPVSAGRFRSNWDLSSARAVSVVHQLVLNQNIDANRVMAAGHAETNPLVPNDSAENRAKNRRVEISVLSPSCDLQELDF